MAQYRPIFLWLIVSLFFLWSCQTPTADGFRQHVVPNDTLWLVVSSPLTFPTYIILTAVDVVIVNPIRGLANIPEWLYDYWSWGVSNESNAVWWSLFPFKAIGIPLVIVSAIMFSEQFVEE